MLTARRLWAGALLALAAMLIAAFLGIHFFGGAYLGKKVSSLGGSSLELGAQPQFSLFPPRLSFADISWRGSLNGLAASFSAAGAEVRPDLLAFIFGKGGLAEVVLDHPILTIAQTPEAGKTSQPGAIRLPVLERLVVRDGRLRLPGLELGNLRLTATNLNPRQEADVQCDFMLAAGATQIGAVALKSKLHYYAPSLTFRSGFASFTAEGLDLSPVQAQFSGSITFASEGSYPGLNFNFEVAEARYHGVVFENGRFQLTGANGDYRISDFACNVGAGLITGRATANLPSNSSSGSYSLALQGESLSLGRILAEGGIRGFEAGQTSFRLKLAAAGKERSGLLATLSGNGALECRDLRLSPFGEMALLLPLLGRAAKFAPDVIERADLVFTAKNGAIRLGPASLSGPGVKGTGNIALNAATGGLTGELRLSAGEFQLPVELGGSLSDLTWRIGAPGKSD